MLQAHTSGKSQPYFFSDQALRGLAPRAAGELFRDKRHPTQETKLGSGASLDIAAESGAVGLAKVQVLRLNVIELRQGEHEIARREKNVLSQSRTDAIGGSFVLR